MTLGHGSARVSASVHPAPLDPAHVERRSLAGDLLAARPGLAGVLGPDTVVVDARPSAARTFGVGLRAIVGPSAAGVSQALSAARADGRPVVLLGQPLFVAEALHRHLAAGEPAPERGLLVLGGYWLPLSLEAWLRSRAPGLHVAQTYAVPGGDVPCLLALARTADGKAIWRPANGGVRVEIRDAELAVGVDGAAPVRTGDLAIDAGDGTVRIRPSGRRLDPAWARALEEWTPRDWDRRTGHAVWRGGHVGLILREGVEPEGAREVRFDAWAERSGASWLQEPRWSPSAA